MSFTDRYGSTMIKSGDIDRLSISLDNNDEGVDAVLLHIPYIHNEEHSHIHLSREDAQTLYGWLSDFLAAEPKELEKRFDKEWNQNGKTSNT